MKRPNPKKPDSIKAFEAALAGEPRPARYRLRLFITGTTPKCTRAIKNIRAICEANLPGGYDLEVIDIYQHPEQAAPEQIVVTPTLVKNLPLPSRRMIGDLSDNERVLAGLDIARRPLPVEPTGNEHGA
ncbi:MAG: circadian clock KaiB family protein [Acidobacteria bacterium]|nr:circadian clock KaiB family protein [Acidobacteriota bacterium]